MSNRSRAISIALIVGLWLLTVVEALGMSVVGVSKFTAGPDGWPGWFETWGYPGWFLVVVGATEAGGALLLLVPRLAFYAAGLLMVVMIGALGTELLNERILGPVAPMIHIGLLTVIGFARRPDRLRRTRRTKVDTSPTLRT